mgnify:CR=1 FL=1
MKALPMPNPIRYLKEWWTNWLMYVVLVVASAMILGLATKLWWRLLLLGWRLIP